MSKEQIRIDASGKSPSRPKSTRRDPESRIALALEAGASQALPPVSELGFETALAAMADNSKAALAADLDCYVDWCLEQRRTAFPADPETIARYLQARDRAGAKPATLARRVASIARAHAMIGIAEKPAAAPIVRDTLKAARRRRGAQQQQAAPLRLGDESDGETSTFTISALLAVCAPDLPGLRDAAMLSLGFDAGLRVSELVAVEVNHIEPHRDGSGTLLIPSSKTDQDGKGAYAWLSAETMRRLGRWLEESGITDGPVFRRIHVRRLKAREAVSPQAYEAIPGNTGNWQQRLQGAPAAAGETIYTLGTNALTRQAVAPIYRKLAEEAWARGLVEAKAGEVDALIRQLSSHSLRVGLTQDLFAAREDGVAISQTLRWKSPATALRYGAKLKVRSNSAARVLGKLRS